MIDDRVGSRSLVECCTPLAGTSMSAEQAVELEQLFRVLGDRHRLRILNVLLSASDKPECVCEFQAVLGISQPTVSHHLKQLTLAGLLEREPRGSFVYYRLSSGAIERIVTLLREPGKGAQAA